MTSRKPWLVREGILFFAFVPFLIGFVLDRFFGQRAELDLYPFFPPVLLLLVFSGASLYGWATMSFAFLLLGFFASEQMTGLMLQNITQRDELSLFLRILPWFPAAFAAAQLGLQNASFLLEPGFSSLEMRLKRCLLTSLLQCLILGCAALASRWMII